MEFLQLYRVRSQVCREFIDAGDSMDINVVSKSTVLLGNLLNSPDKRRDGGVLFYAEMGMLRKYLLLSNHDADVILGIDR